MPDLPRGTVTFLFTDIEGSTSLVQRLGDGYGRLLGDHRHLLRVSVEDAGGVEVDCRADEFFGGFSGAQDAVRAAVSAQRALKLHHWPGGLQPAVRMGIHTGEPALADEGYLGLDVHRAARIFLPRMAGKCSSRRPRTTCSPTRTSPVSVSATSVSTT
jgi:class 3 adenylate cyclase